MNLVVFGLKFHSPDYVLYILNVFIESPRIESSYDGHARYQNDFTQSREMSRDVLKRKSKRKSTVQFKEEPKETKKERRIGVVKRERSKSPGRKVSTAGSRDRSAARNENMDSKRELSRQSATEKKLSTTEEKAKVELPKNQSNTRKISTFALLQQPAVNSNLHSQHTDSNQNEVEKDEEFDKDSNEISLNNRGAENKESDRESVKISLDSRKANKESDRDSNKIAVDSTEEENRESDKEPDKISLESRGEKNKDSNKIAMESRGEQNKESDKESNKISLESRGEKKKEFESDSTKISLNNREEKDTASNKECNEPLVDSNAEKNGGPDSEYNKSPLDNNRERDEKSELSETPGQISTNLDNILTKETFSSTTNEAQDKSRKGAIDTQPIKEHEDDTTRTPQLSGTPNVKNGTGSSSFAGQSELSYNETTHDIDSVKAKQFAPDTIDRNSDIVSGTTDNNAGVEKDAYSNKSDAKISENLNNTLDAPLSLEKETTNVLHKREMKPGVKETTVADPKDIEEITVPLGAETEVTTKPSEREKLRSSFTKESQVPEMNGEPEPRHVPNSKDQVSSKDKINGLKPKKKEVSFVEPTKEQEKIHPKQAISKREEMTSKSAAPTRDSAPSTKVPVKKNSTPSKRDTSPRRDVTPPRKISKVTKAPIQAVSKKESVATDKGTKLTTKNINNEVVPKKLSDTSKTLYAPAKKKVSTVKEPATYYINRDNPGVIIQKKTPPKTKPITPQVSSKSVVEFDKPKPKISPMAVKQKQPTADREDVDSLDLSDSDDEDIFAKAMRKYGITISDDDDE